MVVVTSMCFDCICISVLWLYLHQCVLLYLHQCAMIVFTSLMCACGAVNTQGFVWKVLMRYIKKFIHSFIHPCAVNVLTVCIRNLQVEASVLRVFQVIICPYPQCILYTM